jgi:NO-binding membrane sensor protein with MHYT domain
MNENLRSILVVTAGLSVAALLLTLLRPPAGDRAGRERTAGILLLGLAVQSLHFMEEFVERKSPK